jgi:hypothetical protein
LARLYHEQENMMLSFRRNLFFILAVVAVSGCDKSESPPSQGKTKWEVSASSANNAAKSQAIDSVRFWASVDNSKSDLDKWNMVCELLAGLSEKKYHSPGDFENKASRDMLMGIDATAIECLKTFPGIVKFIELTPADVRLCAKALDSRPQVLDENVFLRPETAKKVLRLITGIEFVHQEEVEHWILDHPHLTWRREAGRFVDDITTQPASKPKSGE